MVIGLVFGVEMGSVPPLLAGETGTETRVG